MGHHTEAYRALIAAIPSHSKGLTPDVMRMCILQVVNGSLQVIAELEERLDDKDKEIDRLTEELLVVGKAQGWLPSQN